MLFIKCIWRTRLARKRVLHLKQERMKIMEHKCVVMIQALYRKNKARKKLSMLRQEKTLRRLREAQESKAQMRIDSFVLLFIARCRFRKQIIASQMHTVLVTIKSANNLLPANVVGNTSDPYVIVTGARVTPVFTSGTNNSISNPMMKTKSQKELRQNLRKTGVQRTICSSKTSVIDGTLDPVWNETVIVSGVYGSDYIVLNIYDKDSFTKDKFLGQVELCLADYPVLFNDIRGGVVVLDDLVLTPSMAKIYDKDGNMLTITDVVPVGKQVKRGTISIVLTLPPLSRRYSVCVYIYYYIYVMLY